MMTSCENDLYNFTFLFQYLTVIIFGKWYQIKWPQCNDIFDMIHVNVTLHFTCILLLTLFHSAHLNLQPKCYKLLEPLIYIQCKIGAFLDNSLVCPEENQSQSTPPKLKTR